MASSNITTAQANAMLAALVADVAKVALVTAITSAEAGTATVLAGSSVAVTMSAPDARATANTAAVECPASAGSTVVGVAWLDSADTILAVDDFTPETFASDGVVKFAAGALTLSLS